MSSLPDTSPSGMLAADPLPGQVLGEGRYRIDALIGAGGMGQVYRATHLALGHEVAIKVVPIHHAPDSTIERFLREAQMSARIAHPNVITVFDVGRTATHVWYAMEFVEGRSLDYRLAMLPELTNAEAVSLVTQVASGLTASHQRQILHRDLKPANILLQTLPDGRLLAKVSDFGIARSLGTDGDGLTVPGQFIGTAEYASPEQMALAANVTGASDTYALALVAARILSGCLPGVPVRYAPTAQGIAQELDLPAPIAHVLFTALAYRAEDRHASPLAFATHLADAMERTGYTPRHYGRSTASAAPQPTELLAPDRRTAGSVPARVIAAAVAAVVVAGAWMLMQRRPDAATSVSSAPVAQAVVTTSAIAPPSQPAATTPRTPTRDDDATPVPRSAVRVATATRNIGTVSAPRPAPLRADSAEAHNRSPSPASVALATFLELSAGEHLTAVRARDALRMGADLLPTLTDAETRAEVQIRLVGAHAILGDMATACQRLRSRELTDSRTSSARAAALFRERLSCDP